MRSVCLTPLVALAIAAVGCGGPDADEARPGATVTTYLRAFADGEGGKACEQFTDRLRHETLAHFRRTYPKTRFTSCANGLDFLADRVLFGDAARTLREAEVESTQVEGATARVTIKGAGRVDLTKVNERWLISGGLIPGGD